MEIKLLNSTQEILNLIADLTGKSFEFIHKPDLSTLAMVKVAREKMPAHLVYYKNIGRQVLCDWCFEPPECQ
jgi:hypothetical protein